MENLGGWVEIGRYVGGWVGGWVGELTWMTAWEQTTVLVRVTPSETVTLSIKTHWWILTRVPILHPAPRTEALMFTCLE